MPLSLGTLPPLTPHRRIDHDRNAKRKRNLRGQKPFSHPCCVKVFLTPPLKRTKKNFFFSHQQKKKNSQQHFPRTRLQSSLPPDHTRLHTRTWIQQPKHKQSRNNKNNNNSNNSKGQTSSFITTSSFSTSHQSPTPQTAITTTCYQQLTSPLWSSPPRQNLRTSWMPSWRPISSPSELPSDKSRTILTIAVVVVIVTVMAIAAPSCRNK